MVILKIDNIKAKQTGSIVSFIFKSEKTKLCFLKRTVKKQKGSIVNYQSFASPT
jgi:hypothetical protein